MSNSQSQPYPGMSLHVSIHISPSDVSAFLAAFKPCFETVAQEPECTYFELFTDPDDPGHLHWVENWTKDKAWFFAEQITKEYYKPYLAATEPMFVKPREIMFYERMAGGWTVSKAENVR